MNQTYFQFCEEYLWQKWLADSICVSEEFTALTEVDLEAVPEPYLYFGNSTKPLIVLTTNPGKTMVHQSHDAVQLGGGPFDKADTYEIAAQKGGKSYEVILPSKSAARQRISRARKLAKDLGPFDGVLQVEVVPFHSATFPKSPKVLAAIQCDSLLRSYVERLRELLHDQPVVVVSAVSPIGSLTKNTALNPWQAWIADIAGVDLPRAEFVPLVEKRNKTTCAAFLSRGNGVPKALSLMMGAPNLPGEKGLRKLAQAMFERKSPTD